MTDLPDPVRQRQLQRCLQRLGLPDKTVVNWQFLDLAFTHSSASASANYEYLEFLGDAALRLAAAEFLMETYPEASVGELAAVRSRLVSDQALAQLADDLGLESFVQMSSSAWGDKAGRRSRLADVFEAVLGVLYLERHNLSLIRLWLDGHLQRLAQQIWQDPTLQNYKAALQELTQAHFKALPQYQTQEVSHIHGDAERFASEVWFMDQCWGSGRGASMKQAEQIAAQRAYTGLKQHLEQAQPATP
ncbi:MAG: ribonuclease III [Cyanobacteria bacterium Co-bin13]|nr:ribonuclease III [Cyanobacteria bacterium Co-bin13]